MAKNRKIQERKQERRLHYNMVAENSLENVFSWYFLIVEESREMARVKQGICRELISAEDPFIVREGFVGNSHGLNYSLFSLRSPLDKIDFSQLYYGKIIKDEGFGKKGNPARLLSILEQEGIATTFPRGHEVHVEKNSEFNKSIRPDYTH